jgi:branched-subunit amino acid aminotransferase/4-amino-4-deoxychorismate lyase
MGHWVEGTFCNVFYQLNHENVWYTPPINRSGVKGVMRQVLLAKFVKSNRAHKERYLANEELAKNRGKLDRFEQNQLAFFERVHQGFAYQAAQQPQRVKRIDAQGTPDEVLAKVLTQLGI